MARKLRRAETENVELVTGNQGEMVPDNIRKKIDYLASNGHILSALSTIMSSPRDSASLAVCIYSSYAAR